MHNSPLVAVHQALKNLEEQLLYRGRWQRATVLVQVLLKVKVEVFEYQVQFVAVRRRPMHNVLQLHNIRVVKLLEECNLSDGRARNSLICVLKPDLLQCHDLNST
jgi:hypothetical protein